MLKPWNWGHWIWVKLNSQLEWNNCCDMIYAYFNAVYLLNQQTFWTKLILQAGWMKKLKCYYFWKVQRFFVRVSLDWWQWCCWHLDVGDLVTSCWCWHLIVGGSQNSENILELSPIHFVSNIRHQHRCNRFELKLNFQCILIHPS